MEIVKVYKENMPAVKMVGKRYTDKDRDSEGSFGSYWRQAFREGWFDAISKGKTIPGVSDDCIGLMRPAGAGNEFEYWIGCFLSPDTEEISGFECMELPAGEIGVGWLRGREDTGELFSPEAAGLFFKSIKEKGYLLSPDNWIFERYHCPRYTQPDETGSIILDLCARLK